MAYQAVLAVAVDIMGLELLEALEQQTKVTLEVTAFLVTMAEVVAEALVN
jgi:hypothetical protein